MPEHTRTDATAARWAGRLQGTRAGGLIAAALVLGTAAAAAAADCPTEFGAGLRLDTDERRLSVEYRPGPEAGLIHETRRDWRPGRSIIERYSERLLHHGMVLDRYILPPVSVNDFDAAPPDGATLIRMGAWDSAMTNTITVPTGSVQIKTSGTIRVDILGTGEKRIGACTYEVVQMRIVVETGTIEVTGDGAPAMDVEAEPPLPRTTDLWYAPALGVALAHSDHSLLGSQEPGQAIDHPGPDDPGPDDPGPVVSYSAITALP